MGSMEKWQDTCAIKLALLFTLTACQLCGGTVLVYVQNGGPAQSPTRFEDVPAMDNFGPRISAQGFAGRLQLAGPNMYGCSPLDKPVMDSQKPQQQQATVAPSESERSTASHGSVARFEGGSGERGDGESLQKVEAAESLPVAVLISRSVKSDPAACTFESKVLNAQAAGYSLVIVYDSEQGQMFRMGISSDEDDHEKIEIPLVLVTHASGLALTALIAASPNPRGPEVYVDNTDPFVGMFVTVNLTMFMLVTGFFLALLTCGSMLVFTLHRYLRRYEDLVAGTIRPMTLPEVLQLPEVQVEEGSRLAGDSCPVCLEAYRAGDKVTVLMQIPSLASLNLARAACTPIVLRDLSLRSLPCSHAFHAGCITPWLTERQRTCPMCKDPVVVGNNASFQDSNLTIERSSSTPPAPASGTDDDLREGRVRHVSSIPGDRLPLLANSRGSSSEGGSIQETCPV